MLKKSRLGLLLLACAFLLPAKASAAGTKGLTVSPAIKDITLAEDAEEENFDFTIKNTTKDTLTLSLSTLDFGALDETGGLIFIGQKDDNKYSLAKWLELETDEIILEPDASRTLKVSVKNDPKLSGGGHYGAVRATPVSGEKTGRSVSVLPSPTVVVLLKKIGGDVSKLDLDYAVPKRSVLSLPELVEIRFKNTGNIHLVPRGTVRLTGPGGRLISKGVINESSSILLPDSARKFDFKFMPGPSALMPGRYTVTVAYRYDGTDTLATYTTHFWYIGIVPLVAAALLVFIVCFVFVKLRQSRKKTYKPKA